MNFIMKWNTFVIIFPIFWNSLSKVVTGRITVPVSYNNLPLTVFHPLTKNKTRQGKCHTENTFKDPENLFIYLKLFFSIDFPLHECIKTCLKVDMSILTCILFTFNWLTLISEMYFVKFHPEVASCLLSRGKKKVCNPGDEAILKIHKLFSVIPFNFILFVIPPKLQRIWSWNFGFAIRKIWAFILISKNMLLPVEPWGMRMWSA